MRVLIVEDARDIAGFLEAELKEAGYETLVAYDGRAGLDFALGERCDVILLDMLLPVLDGWEFLLRLREKSATPVICVSACDGLRDKIRALDAGAHDYVTKPFHMEEILARIRVVMREKNAHRLRIADLELEGGVIRRAGVDIDFTPKEYDLMAYFMHNPGRVLTRETLLSEVWGYDFQGGSNIVDVYVRYVRVKVNEGHSRKHIETVRGRGYVFKGEME